MENCEFRSLFKFLVIKIFWLIINDVRWNEFFNLLFYYQKMMFLSICKETIWEKKNVKLEGILGFVYN